MSIYAITVRGRRSTAATDESGTATVTVTAISRDGAVNQVAQRSALNVRIGGRTVEFDEFEVVGRPRRIHRS